MTMTKNLLISFFIPGSMLLGLAMLMSGNLHAEEDSDHERLLTLRDAEDILPFDTILEKIRPMIKGTLVEIEFEIEEGQPAYEVKFIDGTGRMKEVYVNAKTGLIIKDKID